MKELKETWQFRDEQVKQHTFSRKVNGQVRYIGHQPDLALAMDQRIKAFANSNAVNTNKFLEETKNVSISCVWCCEETRSSSGKRLGMECYCKECGWMVHEKCLSDNEDKALCIPCASRLDDLSSKPGDRRDEISSKVCKFEYL